MTEEEARSWLRERFHATAVDRCAAFVDLVLAENQRQNLLAPSTVPTIWSRHVVDSAQLIAFAPPAATHWLDIGTGGGFPGMVVALLTREQVTLVEPRKRRAAFLAEAVTAMGIVDRVNVIPAKIEQVTASADVISARAVAPVEKLLQASEHCATSGTRWILPRGRMTVDDTPQRPGVMFHVEQSLTDAGSTILIGDRA